MATLRPFRAVRPRPELAPRIASPPYDVVDTAEARRIAEGNPYSFLHVVRSEIDLAADTDPYDPAVYRQAASAYRHLLAEGALLRDPQPALFVYRQVMGDHEQTGVVGCCSVDEYDADVVRKHERTRPDKEDDRTRHILEVGIHAGPVFLTYRDAPAIDRLVAEVVAAAPPLYDFAADDGVLHTVWRVPASDPLVAAFAAVPSLYVADGHHRSAASSRARAARRAAHGPGEHDWFLAVLFPASQLAILPYNRVVHDLAGATPTAFLAALAEVMVVEEDAGPAPPGPGRFSMYLAGSWYGLAPRVPPGDDPVERLDAAVLQHLVLGPLLEIGDPRTSDRIDFVGGIRGTAELARRVDARGHGAAFSLWPVGVDALMEVADAGLVLPPKSTWFEPKLRSGLLVHEI